MQSSGWSSTSWLRLVDYVIRKMFLYVGKDEKDILHENEKRHNDGPSEVTAIKKVT